MKVTVLGTGSWGTTMAQVLVDAGNDVLMWGRNSDVVNEINQRHTNSGYLSDITLPTELKASTDITHAFKFSNFYVLAIPAQQLRAMLNEWKPLINPSASIVSTLKGIEVETQMRMSEVIAQVTGAKEVAVLTGPNLADELILPQPSGAVAAAESQELADLVQSTFRTKYYRVYTSTDLLGCELAGTFKNVIALAVGVSIGMGFGENTQAMLITRGLNEVARLCAAHGADPLSAAGLAGMGDLVASCGSPLSRNRTFGEYLGREGTMERARKAVPKTVEGVASAAAVLEIAHRVGVEVPLIEAVADMVAEIITPQQAFARLMEITTKAETLIR